jgi:hypothetical protein
MAPVPNPRVLLAAAVVVTAAVLAAVLLPGAGGGSPGNNTTASTGKTTGQGVSSANPGVDPPLHIVHAKLTLEQFKRLDTGKRELLVSLPGSQLNSEDLTGGTAVVWLRCFDGSGTMIVRQPYDWPLLEEAGYPPHMHQPATARMLRTVRNCRLTGPGIRFEGRVTGRLPTAT